MAGPKEVDELSGVETTGHEWDGMKELNNPLPRWWLWVWLATAVWAVGYWFFYPAWPGISGYTRGLLENSDRKNVEASVAALQEKRAALGARILQIDLGQVDKDPQLFEFVRSAGATAFGLHCAACHGSGAQGAPGYPNLNDDSWLWGGTVEDIAYTIRHGVRNQTDPDARLSQMPAFYRDQFITADQLNTLTNYVLFISGQAPQGFDPAAGKELFVQNCAGCHGESGIGDRSQGAPNLTDAIWLYGSDRESIRTQIANGRNGVMPSWGDKLDEMTIRSLAVYVHTLGGGE